MKKSLTQLLIILVISIIITIGFCYLSMEYTKVQLNETSKTNELMDSPGGGWFILPALMADGISMAITVFFIYSIPVIISIITVVLQVIARFIYVENSKNKSSKVLTCISLAFQILLCVYLLVMQNNILLILAAGVNIISIIIFIIELRKMKKINTEIKAEVVVEK